MTWENNLRTPSRRPLTSVEHGPATFKLGGSLPKALIGKVAAMQPALVSGRVHVQVFGQGVCLPCLPAMSAALSLPAHRVVPRGSLVQ